MNGLGLPIGIPTRTTDRFPGPTDGRTDELTHALADSRVNPSAPDAHEKSNLIEIQQAPATKRGTMTTPRTAASSDARKRLAEAAADLLPVQEDDATLERAARVLAEHMWSASDTELCSCGWTPDAYWQQDAEDDRRYVADVLVNAEEGDEPDVWAPLVQAFTQHQAAALAGVRTGRSDTSERFVDGNGRTMSSLEAAMFNAWCDLDDDTSDYEVGRRLACAALDAIPRTGRSEAEIKAEGAREALRDFGFWLEKNIGSPAAHLRAYELAAQGTDTEGSGT